MPEKNEPIFWNGREVGHVTNPTVDNFDYYGIWQPTSDSELYGQFLKEVDTDGGAKVEVGALGSPLTGTVEIEPDHEVEVKIRPRV